MLRYLWKCPAQASLQKDWWLPEVWGTEEWRITANEYEVSFWGDRNVPELDSGDGCSNL